MKIATILTLAVLSAASFSSFAVDGYYSDKARGWFWHEDADEDMPLNSLVPLPQPVPAPTPAPAARPQATEPPPPDNFSVEWYEKNLKKIRNAAIDNPTYENVTAMLAAERVMRDKATKVSGVAQEVLKTTPWLDENARTPITPFGERVGVEKTQVNIGRWGKEVGKQTAIWFFFRSDCPYCKAQIPVLKSIAAVYGFTIMPVSMDGMNLPDADPRWVTRIDRGQSQSLGVTVTPTLFLARPPGDIVPLAYGLTPGDEIVSRAIDVAANQGWISQGAKSDIRITRQDADASSDVRYQRPVSHSDPKRIADLVKQMLKGN